MANPRGVNQLSPQGYGQKLISKQLQREAPVSGAPLVGPALNTPQRNQRRATSPTQSRQQAPPPMAPPPQPTPGASVGQVWQIVAANPGASDLVRYYAQQGS